MIQFKALCDNGPGDFPYFLVSFYHAFDNFLQSSLSFSVFYGSAIDVDAVTVVVVDTAVVVTVLVVIVVVHVL